MGICDMFKADGIISLFCLSVSDPIDMSETVVWLLQGWADNWNM